MPERQGTPGRRREAQTVSLRPSYLAGLLLLLGLGLLALGVCVGSTGFENLLQPLLHPSEDPEQTAMARQIVGEIRLPRTLGAWAAGALLGLAGAVAQGLFRTPLADPYLLARAFFPTPRPTPTRWASPRAPRWVWRWRWQRWAVTPACWAPA